VNDAVVIHRIYELPWSTGAEQEQKFRRLVLQCLGALLLLSIVFSVLPVAERDPLATQEIPQRFARLVLEREPPPPPPPVIEQPEPEPIVEPEPEPIIEPEPVVEQTVMEPDPEPVIEPEPAPQPDVTEQARERAAVAGLLPFAQDLAALRTNDTLERLGQSDTLGTVEGDAPVVERSLITSRAGSRSAGIRTSDLSRSTGGEGLAGRTTTQIESPIEGIGPAGGDVSRSGTSSRPSRSREEIEIVFDRNKGAIFALYNRALRENPALVGKVVLRLTIEPDGRVTFCEIVSSELGDADLEQRLVQRVLLFQFEAKDVEPITTTKPIDFFPA
jgi:TonB family protein